MNQPPPITFSLLQNFSWTMVGNVVYSACQWGMLIVLAKLGTPEMVGEFTYALAVTAPVFMFTNLQLRAVQSTDAQSKYSFNDYLGLRLTSTGAALAMLVVMAGLLFSPTSTAIAVVLMGLAKAIESVSDVCYGLAQQHERMDFISISLILKGLLSLVMLSMGLVISGTVLGGIIGLTLAWLVLLLGYDLPTVRRLGGLRNARRYLSGRYHWPTQRKLIWLTLPLGFVMFLVSLNTNIPRYFIEHYLSPRELGIFAAIAYLMLVGSIIQGAMAQAASPRLAKYYAQGNRRAFSSLLLKLIGLALGLGLGAIAMAQIAGAQILTVVYQPEYAQYADLLVWLMVAAALDYVASFLGTAMTAARYFRSQVPLFICTASLLAIACFYCIPLWGLNGIVFAMILASMVRTLLCLVVLTHALRHNPTQTAFDVQSRCE
jgi:O-antigen/teichoic acid export membrane protein